MVEVSIIIVNWNGAHHLEKCLESVLSATEPSCEVILVDNASTDESIEVVKNRFGHDQRLKIIQNKKNLGFSEGNNVGLKHAKGKYVVFLGPDTKVTRGWLRELIKAIERDPAIGAAQSKLLLMEEPCCRFDCAGGFINQYGFSCERGSGEPDEGQYEEFNEIFYAKGASMIIKREVLEKVGYFDPRNFIYYEETDLCWRIWLAGYRIVYVPTSKVYHAGGGSTPKRMIFREYHAVKNRLMTLIKNHDDATLVKVLPCLILLETRKAALWMLKRDVTQVYIFLKALFWNLLNFRVTWQKRQMCQHLIRKVPDGFVTKNLMRNAS